MSMDTENVPSTVIRCRWILRMSHLLSSDVNGYDEWRDLLRLDVYGDPQLQKTEKPGMNI